MKSILKRCAPFGAVAILSTVFCQFAAAQNAAVEALKSRGRYDSVIEAFNAARQSRKTSATARAVADIRANLIRDPENVALMPNNTWTQEAQKVAGDGASSDQFGYSVAISGDTAIVGALQDDVGSNANQGSAYIFVRSGSAWNQQQKLVASDGSANDNFGTSVAISGDTVIVGAPIAAVGGTFNQGAAYVFVRSGTTWTQQQKLVAADGATDDQFGTSVGIGGETAIVGASLDNVGANADQGAAYIFLRSGAAWAEQQKLAASDGAPEDLFGISVSVSGNTAIVGAFLDDVGANIDQGSAYIFVRSGTVWAQQTQLIAGDGAAEDLFGISTSISAETVIVGAPLDDVGANIDQGSAYVFFRSGAAWTQQARFSGADGAADDLFGNSTGLSGDAAVVGSFSSSGGGNLEQGSAYVFARSGGAWTQRQKLTAAGGAAGDNFGNGVSISGSRIVVGAPFSDASVSTPRTGGAFETERGGIPTLADQGAAVFFVNTLPPTSANVTVAGRVLSPDGKGLYNAFITLTNQNGATRTTRTNPFGYYRFKEVASAQTYIIAARAKRYQFASQIVNVTEDINELNLIGTP